MKSEGRKGTFGIHIRAEKVLNNGNGTFTVLFEGTEIDPKDRDVLHRLYPKLAEQAYNLLGQEVMLASVVDYPANIEKGPNDPPATEVQPTKPDKKVW